MDETATTRRERTPLNIEDNRRKVKLHINVPGLMGDFTGRVDVLSADEHGGNVVIDLDGTDGQFILLDVSFVD